MSNRLKSVRYSNSPLLANNIKKKKAYNLGGRLPILLAQLRKQEDSFKLKQVKGMISVQK